jgi:hypothetical protein
MIPDCPVWSKGCGKFCPKGPKLTDPKTHDEPGAGLGEDAGRQKKIGHQHGPPSHVKMSVFEEMMCVQAGS